VGRTLSDILEREIPEFLYDWCDAVCYSYSPNGFHFTPFVPDISTGNEWRFTNAVTSSYPPFTVLTYFIQNDIAKLNEGSPIVNRHYWDCTQVLDACGNEILPSHPTNFQSAEQAAIFPGCSGQRMSMVRCKELQSTGKPTFRPLPTNGAWSLEDVLSFDHSYFLSLHRAVSCGGLSQCIRFKQGPATRSMTWSTPKDSSKSGLLMLVIPDKVSGGRLEQFSLGCIHKPLPQTPLLLKKGLANAILFRFRVDKSSNSDCQKLRFDANENQAEMLRETLRCSSRADPYFCTHTIAHNAAQAYTVPRRFAYDYDSDDY